MKVDTNQRKWIRNQILRSNKKRTIQSPTTISHGQTRQKKKKKKRISWSNRSVKVVYEIKLSSMRSQIKSPIKDQFSSDTMLKSKKILKEIRKSRISYMNSLKNRYNIIRT